MTEAAVSGAPQGMPAPEMHPGLRSMLGHADDNLVLAHRLGEWISKAPELEIDIALGNIGLDHLGVARALLRYTGGLEGKGRGEDDLAMGRTDREFFNLLLVEQPNCDFAHSMVRQFFVDSYQLQLWPDLAASDDPMLAGIAAKAKKETEYHYRFSHGWMLRMGDGTEESHGRVQDAVDHLWRFTAEMFEGDALEVDLSSDGVGVDVATLRVSWEHTIDDVFRRGQLQRPADPFQRGGGRAGIHTEHLGYLLAEMQWMQRTYPGLEW